MQRFSLCIAFLFLLMHAGTAQTERLKIGVITGGHDFDSTAFFAMFDSFGEMEYRQITQPASLEKIYADKIFHPEVLVFYDMQQLLTIQAEAVFHALLNQGTGLVFLHHSLVSYQFWPEYKKIVGGKYHEKNSPDATQLSTYQHDVTFRVQVLDPQHPVCLGLKDFDLYDEVYGQLEVLPDVHPLLATNHPQSNSILAWSHKVKNAHIVYIQPGHDLHAFQDANYRRLLRQAIHYVRPKTEN